MHTITYSSGHLYLNGQIDMGIPAAALTIFPHLITQIKAAMNVVNTTNTNTPELFN